MAQKILILGASARAAAFSAFRAGHQPVTVDLFADADLAEICRAESVSMYPNGFARWLESLSYDCWMTTGATENYPTLIEQWANRFPGYRGSDAIAIRAVRTDNWRRVVSDAGFSIPLQQVLPPDNRPLSGRWLRKSRRSANGLQIADANGSDHFPEAYYQQYIEGTALSGVFVATDNRCDLLGITKQLLGREWGGPSEFAYVGSVGPLRSDEYGDTQWNRLGNVLAERCGLRGVFGVDAVMHDNEIWPIEVNPRFPASAEILERADAELSVVDLHVKCFGPGDQYATAAPRQLHAKSIVWASETTRISAEMSTSLLKRRYTPGSTFPTLADIPKPGTIARSHPILTVFARATATSFVEDELRDEIRAIRSLLEKDQDQR